MAYGQDGLYIPGLVASTDLSTHQYEAVKIDSNGQVALQATEGDTIAGILQDAPTMQGQPCQVQNRGVAKAKAGASITCGAILMVATTSKLITASATKNVVGRALTGASTNDIIPVSLDEKGYKAS